MRSQSHTYPNYRRGHFRVNKAFDKSGTPSNPHWYSAPKIVPAPTLMENPCMPKDKAIREISTAPRCLGGRFRVDSAGFPAINTPKNIPKRVIVRTSHLPPTTIVLSSLSRSLKKFGPDPSPLNVVVWSAAKERSKSVSKKSVRTIKLDRIESGSDKGSAHIETCE
jgi:hypothetical protein